jgi:hypothetical protein
MTASELAFYLAAFPAAFLVGASKGGLPMVGMLGVPVLALVISPVQAAGLLLPIYVVSDLFGLWVYRRNYDKRNLAILVPAAILGIGFGWATAHWVTEAEVTLLVGLIGLAFCLDAWFRPKDRPPRPADVPRGVFWGALAGFTSFVSHSGAPPYQWYVLPQRLDKLVYAGTTTIAFAVINAVKLVPYYFLGQLSLENLQAAAVIAPVAIAATFVGAWAVRRIPQGPFFRLVEIGLLVISLKLIWDGASAML